LRIVKLENNQLTTYCSPTKTRAIIGNPWDKLSPVEISPGDYPGIP